MNPALLWFLIGVALFVLEFVAPGVVVVFFSLGAWITALTTWLGWTNDLEVQLLVFTFSTLILFFTLRSTIKKWFIGEGQTESPSDEYIGHQVTVVETIPEGGINRGIVEHKGSHWKAVSEVECKQDSLVEITLPKNSNIHASEYKLYLPSKEELKQQLIEAEQGFNHD